ncbi:nickel pincer cofactor biosynthesis protein LarC [Candidatus Poribacteria bacterium]|nr:MAG: nickel pincer cofactor biosynthesis protein LarC [Candidatus Poribacteria bacterium]
MQLWRKNRSVVWSNAYIAGVREDDEPSKVFGQALLYECFSGISGDMHIGALIDVGVPEEHIQTELSKLGLEDEFELHVTRDKKQGISGTLATVELKKTANQAHRSLADIRQIYESSTLDESVILRSMSMFEALAVAEAKIHDVGVNEIHFHEVGAVDAIVDITTAAVGLKYIQPDLVLGTEVELGSGWVKCAHGVMPVPAPATAELLLDTPTHRGGVDGEATTPTGATILRCNVQSWEGAKSFKTTKIGYGIGHKEFSRPNVLRLSLGYVSEGIQTESNCLIECNIDDMSPEAFEPLFDKLFELGAKDVFFSPITMKRARPGTKLSVLCEEVLHDSIANCLFNNSSTIGLRTSLVQKQMLPRDLRKIATRYGTVQVKISQLPDGTYRWKSEYADVLQIARDRDLPYLRVKDQIDKDVAATLESG